jgi:hypothetical protein
MSLAIADLREWLNLGAVAVVGAGLSLEARYPSTVNLVTLLWDAIDSDPRAREGLATGLGLPDAPTKTLIGDKIDRLDVGWRTIAQSQTARDKFQHSFVELDRTRAPQPSPGHEALARLMHAGIVECVISYNWDSALERAYERLYGVRPAKGLVYKPHGDVEDPESAWILPHEDGSVGSDVDARLRTFEGQHPRVLLIVGYSERDRAVVDQIIRPLDARWRVSRVGPSVDGVDDVAGRAADVLAALADPIARREAESRWHVVTFNSQRGIESALEGRRLLPVDVTACPRLPEVEWVKSSLLRSHSVVLNGDSGSGKSITAYQVAHDLSKEGYEVLRLRDSARRDGILAWLADLGSFPHRKLLFIDDAQDMTSDAVRELAEVASPGQLLLVAGVDHVAGGVVTHNIGGAAAVGTLEQYVLNEREQMLALVRQLDDRVGDGMADERFESRVQDAARETTAWRFFYVLTGGWRRTARALQEVRDEERADLLACGLAVAQIAGVDGGVTEEGLLPYALALGRTAEWVSRNLVTLSKAQLAVEEDGVWRCPHLRTAYSIVNWMLHPPPWTAPPPAPPVEVPPIASGRRDLSAVPTSRAEDKRTATARLRLPERVVEDDRTWTASLFNVALDSQISMRGVAWLLGRRSFSSDAQWVLRRRGVRSPDRDRSLALEALRTPAGPDVAMAAQLLEDLAGPDAREIVEAVWQEIDAVVAWVDAITPEVGWAVARLINLLINDDRPRIEVALAEVDPARLAGLVEAGGWPHIYSTTQAIDRIAQSGAELARAVGSKFDEVGLDEMLDNVPDLGSADDLLGMLAYLNPDMGIRLFENHAGRFASVFSPRPLESYPQMFRTFAFLLGYAPGFLRRRHPSASAKRAVRTFLRGLDTTALIRELSRPQSDWRWHNFWEFLSMYSQADPAGWAEVVASVNMQSIESALSDQLPVPSQDLLYVLYLLSGLRGDEVRSLLDAHADAFGHLHAFVAHIHPELAVALLRRGLPLDLGLEHQRYETAAEELDLIGMVDPVVGRETAEANLDAFRAGLARKFTPAFENLDMWVRVCDRWAPSLIDSALAGLDEGVVGGWVEALRNRKSKSQIGPIVIRAAESGHGPASREAVDLLRRFPSLRNNMTPQEGRPSSAVLDELRMH